MSAAGETANGRSAARRTSTRTPRSAVRRCATRRLAGAVALPADSASATLRRHGRTLASGAARRVGSGLRVTLNAARTLPAERYTLSLTYVDRTLERRHTNNVVRVGAR